MKGDTRFARITEDSVPRYQKCLDLAASLPQPVSSIIFGRCYLALGSISPDRLEKRHRTRLLKDLEK